MLSLIHIWSQQGCIFCGVGADAQRGADVLMRLITVSGPPSSGKTSVVIRAVEQMGGGEKVMVVKFDCLSSTDQERYQRAGIRAVTGLSGNQCPDHFYISNVEDCAKRAQAEGFEYLIVESAGLCNRCAPHLKDCLAVCVIDNLSGVNTPHKIGPMLRFADVVAAVSYTHLQTLPGRECGPKRRDCGPVRP